MGLADHLSGKIKTDEMDDDVCYEFQIRSSTNSRGIAPTSEQLEGDGGNLRDKLP